jgi:predicted DCC family thiol-disulfide oxidoreductase YuxK
MRYPGRVDGKARSILLIDGECNVCTWTVRFVLPRDPEGRFAFATLQSPRGRRLVEQAGLPPDCLDTVVLLEDGAVHRRSSAVLRVVRRLSGAWPLLCVLWLIPRPLRDGLYDAFAARRYRWFGRRAVCLVPTPDLTPRFLD